MTIQTDSQVSSCSQSHTSSPLESPVLLPQEDFGDGANNAEAVVSNDPYLLADAAYIEKDIRWKNKQRTLVFSTRGIPPRYRHLMEDLKKLLPHHRTEPKWEKKHQLQDLNELCELKSCNNVVFFEVRKKKELYLWIARSPSGPSVKFQVYNTHTLGELKMTGNCLKHSRPLLSFDGSFEESAPLRVMKELFVQALGTPRNHPKSKPFFDHVMSFSYFDNKIWFRHYQVMPRTPDSAEKPEDTTLVEIGPRFVLDPVKILAGSFRGEVLYHHPTYLSPVALRRIAAERKMIPVLKKIESRKRLEEHRNANQPTVDSLDFKKVIADLSASAAKRRKVKETLIE